MSLERGLWVTVSGVKDDTGDVFGTCLEGMSLWDVCLGGPCGLSLHTTGMYLWMSLGIYWVFV